MAQSKGDPRQQPLPPQYDLATYRKKHRLSSEDAQKLLDTAGDDRQVADSLARIHHGGARPGGKKPAEGSAMAARIDQMSGGRQLGGTHFGQQGGDADSGGGND